ncbi:MAG: tryptophan--tRNA ligase, partial [Bdellovibrionales bacterium]|nr:tryptophan--tRNA ligase [Bdellovibrionales bacterium]
MNSSTSALPTNPSRRIFSGIQPSGAQVHLGNYLGAMKRFVTLSKEAETIFCLVDLHALTSVERRADLQSFSQSLAASYLAIGLDPEKTVLFRQSDVPQVCELSWYLSCQFPLGLLERAHALKDARDKGRTPNSGVMFYPILMAADILLYKATEVPVGADQKQHIEMTREVAQRINNRFGELFPLPEPLIDENTGIIPGIDGRKMSKSYDNYVGLFEPAKALRKKIMKIVTDSKTVEEPKDPDTCNVFQLYRLFATTDEQAALAARYRAGGMGYGDAKQALFEAVDREVRPLR